MNRALCAVFALACACLPALAQPSGKPASVEARLTALEKENAALRADVDRLQKMLSQTRTDLATRRGAGVGFLPPPPAPGTQPMDLSAQQAQTNAAIQSQSTQTQLNNLQLQQNMMQDRAREQQLFQPQTFGATP
jgi:hypothetical protein